MTAREKVYRDLAPEFVSWDISFVTVCVIRLNRHRLLRLAGRIDACLFRANANLLLGPPSSPSPPPSWATTRATRSPSRSTASSCSSWGSPPPQALAWVSAPAAFACDAAVALHFVLLHGARVRKAGAPVGRPRGLLPAPPGDGRTRWNHRSSGL